MKLRFTIGRKIAVGFAVLLITTLVVFLLTYDTLRTGRSINDRINNVYNPSVTSLEQLKSTVLRSRTLINMWAYVQSREDTKEKKSLVSVIQEEIPAIKHTIDSLSTDWTDDERRKKEKIYSELDKLLAMYSEIQTTLVSMQDYDSPMVRFAMTEYAEEGGLIFQQAREVNQILSDLIIEQRQNALTESVTMINSFDRLEGYLKNAGLMLFLFGVLIAIVTARSITLPIKKLRQMLLALGSGQFPQQSVVDTGDEVGDMSRALNRLINGLKSTTSFANEVGKGNFETHFKPLSQEDVLGNALLLMRDGLNVNQQKLEQKVVERTRTIEESRKELVKQKNRIEKQNTQLEELLDNITASIRYAKRLQENILPSSAQVSALLPSMFIYFKPKDIVSGDFYYIKKIHGKVIFAAVDCTGHGVPGAFMSLVGHNALNHAVANNMDCNPGRILKDISEFAAEAMNRMANDSSSRDGMDLALCVYDEAASILEYAGAFNPLYLVRKGEITVVKPDKISIGAPEQAAQNYTSHTFKLLHDDMIYISSDGYVDQFGGREGRKFMRKPFREMLMEISIQKPADQLDIITNRMEAWRTGAKDHMKLEQVDDMLIMGMRHQVK